MLRLRMMADQVASVPIDAGIPCDDAGRACAPFRYRVPVLGWLKPMGLSRAERRRLYDALRAGWPLGTRKAGIGSTVAGLVLAVVLLDQLSYLIATGNVWTIKFVQPVFGLPVAVLLMTASWLWVPPTNPALFRRTLLRLGRCPACRYRIDRSAKDGGGRRVCSECGHAWWLPGDDKRGGQTHAEGITPPPLTTTSTGLPPNS